MKSNGILSRYMRPGYEAGGETFDDKKRKESDKKWKEEQNKVKKVLKNSNINLDRLKQMLDRNSEDPELVEAFPALSKYGTNQTANIPVETIFEDINSINFGDDGNQYVDSIKKEIKAVAKGVKELSPSKLDIVDLSQDDIDERIKNKDFRENYEKNNYSMADYWKEDAMPYNKKINLPDYVDDILGTEENVYGNEDVIIDPNNFETASELYNSNRANFDAAELIKEGKLDSATNKRVNRYVNASDPSQYAKQENINSYDNENMDMLKMAGEYMGEYYGDGEILPSISGENLSGEVNRNGIPVEKVKEFHKFLAHNTSGILKLIPEYGAALGRMIFPVSPKDVYQKGWKEAWSGDTRNVNWGLNDSLLKDFKFLDKYDSYIPNAIYDGYKENDPAGMSTMDDAAYIPYYSEFMSGNEFGDTKGSGTSLEIAPLGDTFKPDKSLYSDYDKETPDKVKKLIMEMSYMEALDKGDNERAQRIQDSYISGKFPSFLDYSDFSRLNVKYNTPGHVALNVGSLLLTGGAGGPGAAVGTKAAIASKLATTVKGAAAAKKAAIAAKLAGTAGAAKLGLGAKAGIPIGGYAAGLGYDNLNDTEITETEDLNFEEDFFNQNLYRTLPTGIL
tara:strand:- start:1169 stop:3031 length:1863 start_codon:yes stop_codon:yes gene_type:complete